MNYLCVFKFSQSYNRRTKLIVLTLLFYVLNITCYSQNKTLNLYFSDTKNEKVITLRYSVLGLINYTYEPYIQTYKTDSNYLSMIIPDSITSFLMNIDSKPLYNWGKNANFFIDKKEKIDIYLDTILPPRFIGDNASVYKFMFDLKNGTGNERMLGTLQEYLGDQSTHSFFDFIDNKIKLDRKTIDSINTVEKINPDFYNYVKGIIIDDYLYRAGSIGRLLSKDYLEKADSATFFTDVVKLYESYTTIHTDGIGIGSKASLKGMGLIPKAELDLGLDYEFKPYIYLNKEEQENVAAAEIIITTSMGQLDSLSLITKVNKFRHAFPNSMYLSILTSLRVSEKKDFILAHFSKKDGFNELGRLKVNQLTDITKMFLGGKPVFLDFWATWCAPCLKEFNYRDELDLFLNDNNIGMMYISLDFGGNYDQWKKTIIDKKLEGFHYLPTPELAQNLPYFKESNAIPRFILIDKEGNILIDKSEYPSSGKLIPQIKEKLDL